MWRKIGIFRNPAQEAGIRVGDVLTELDGQPVSLNEDVSAIIASSGGREIPYTLKLEGPDLTGTLQPHGLQPVSTRPASGSGTVLPASAP